MDATWVAIIVTVTLAVVAGLVAHIRSDAQVEARARERMSKVETEVSGLKGETERTREHVHKLRDDLPKIIKDLIDWFLKDRK